MFYKFTDDVGCLRFIRFCEISEVNVTPESAGAQVSKPVLNLIMGNGKVFTKTFPLYEDATAAAESVIRLAVSYKRNSKPPFKKNFQRPVASPLQPRSPQNNYRNNLQNR
jgi:hypothetical protein